MENLVPGANYTQIDPTTFQFSETLLEPGISKETNLVRITEIQSSNKYYQRIHAVNHEISFVIPCVV